MDLLLITKNFIKTERVLINMRIKQIKVYKYEELSKESKEKALENYRTDLDYDCLGEDMKLYTEQELENNKIYIIEDSLELAYDLSYCQGRFYSFFGHFKWKCYYITIERGYRHNDELIVETIYGNEAKEEVIEEFKSMYNKMCKSLMKMGEENMEYNGSEEYFIDYCEGNELEFKENGEMI